MSRKPLELPQEARDLIAEVSALEARAARAREQGEADLKSIRKTAAEERKKAESAAMKAVKAKEADLARLSRAIDKEIARRDEDRQALAALVEDRVRGFEFIAAAWADYELARSRHQAAALETKSHPARSAAEEVRAKGKQLAEARRELKRAEWVLRLYEFHFPWLTDLRDLEEEQAYVQGEQEIVVEASPRSEDPAGRWLSAEEYKALPENERNQRALDRYLKSRKSAWQIGRDYERYVGYLREQDGATVTYQGIFAGLEDLGRDLLAENNGQLEVIQCKHWSRKKVIHEKHVFQLFGTVVACRIENPGKEITATFTTTTVLSERARRFAEQLEVRVEENFPLSDYPRIKCNISQTGERIYHLPFDQQYDKTAIEPERGEQYVATCAEAEELGYRRAWRWRGAKAAAS